jgi:hypothetical protein
VSAQVAFLRRGSVRPTVSPLSPETSRNPQNLLQPEIFRDRWILLILPFDE